MVTVPNVRAVIVTVRHPIVPRVIAMLDFIRAAPRASIVPWGNIKQVSNGGSDVIVAGLVTL